MFERFLIERNAKRLRKLGREHGGKVARLLGVDEETFFRAMDRTGYLPVEMGVPFDNGEPAAQTAKKVSETLQRGLAILAKEERTSDKIARAKHALGPAAHLEEGTVEVLRRYAVKLERREPRSDILETRFKNAVEAVDFPGGYDTAMLLIKVACDDAGRGGVIYNAKSVAKLAGVSEQRAIAMWQPLVDKGWCRADEWVGEPSLMLELSDRARNAAVDAIIWRLNIEKALKDS